MPVPRQVERCVPTNFINGEVGLAKETFGRGRGVREHVEEALPSLD
jgi:hypothetical protein